VVGTLANLPTVSPSGKGGRGSKVSVTAKKVNKNANDAEGNYVLYEVKDIDGTPLKVGKADADRTNAAGFPKRMMDNRRKAQKAYPSATASEIPNSRTKTTGDAKNAEAKRYENILVIFLHIQTKMCFYLKDFYLKGKFIFKPI
jgi:hypothetical protein